MPEPDPPGCRNGCGQGRQGHRGPGDGRQQGVQGRAVAVGDATMSGLAASAAGEIEVAIEAGASDARAMSRQ